MKGAAMLWSDGRMKGRGAKEQAKGCSGLRLRLQVVGDLRGASVMAGGYRHASVRGHGGVHRQQRGGVLGGSV